MDLGAVVGHKEKSPALLNGEDGAAGAPDSMDAPGSADCQVSLRLRRALEQGRLDSRRYRSALLRLSSSAPRCHAWTITVLIS